MITVAKFECEERAGAARKARRLFRAVSLLLRGLRLVERAADLRLVEVGVGRRVRAEDDQNLLASTGSAKRLSSG